MVKLVVAVGGSYLIEVKNRLTRRRAVFSHICVSQRGRFVKRGECLSLEVAGFRIFLILDKDRIVRAFHNACHQLAYPVTKKASGSATVLGCRYHGWNYNTKGELTKPPHLDKAPGFDKSENSLLEIHTKMDNYRFLYVNLSGSRDTGDNNNIPELVQVGQPVKIRQTSQFLESWEWKGNFNWKLTVMTAREAVFQ
ncbi:hypothetical protein ACJZ2D_000592 [Fusarium nematophilum]